MKPIKLKSLIKEPLVHFLLIGALLFILSSWRDNPSSISGEQKRIESDQIVVSNIAIGQMNSQFEKTWQRPPDAKEQKGLIDNYIRNEIFYREAIAIGLDRDDEVIKQRLRKRMEFIYEDIASLKEPDDKELGGFLRKHREKYLTDQKFAFQQVYIDMTKRGEKAQSDARQILSDLSSGPDPDIIGDPTLLQTNIELSPLWKIKSQFGDKFVTHLLKIEPGIWKGPLQSGYGLHLVFIKEKQSGYLPDLMDVREMVKRDWMISQQNALKDTAYEKIRQRYKVIVEKSDTVAAGFVMKATRQ